MSQTINFTQQSGNFWIYTPIYTNLPKDAVNLAIDSNKYKLGQCTWASKDSIHICGCHKVLKMNTSIDVAESKLRIGLLTKDLPKETNLVQQKWWTNKNTIHIIYTDRQGNNPKEFVWIWTGKQFKLMQQ